MLEGYEQYDIREYSFDEFVRFLFEREVVQVLTESDSDVEPWYWNVEVDYNPERTIRYYIRLFSNPKFLLSTYSEEQLEQGFWAIQSPNIECSISQLIWDTQINFKERAKSVETMEILFRDLFQLNSLDTSSNMWWDSLAYDWYCDNRSRNNGGEDEIMQDVMFNVLQRILDIDSEDCRYAALHGLGHLMHPETTNVINDFLISNINVSEDLKVYASAAAKFEVM